MEFRFGEAFRDICRQIVSEDHTLAEWSEIESCDMFQQDDYVGGFEAIEQEFCFSVFREDGEFWFQVSLDQIHRIAEGSLDTVDIRPAE